MDLIVNRADLHETRIVNLPAPALQPGQARLSIERFGLSANNITYAVIGDMLQYWDFFPAEAGWGRIPVWGYAEVVESTDATLAVGQRVFGFLPMSSELVVNVGRADAGGFTDVSAHRAPMAGAYNRYLFVAPTEQAGSADEDRRMLLYPLFFTSFLADDFLGDNDYFGASVLVISSASSKTGLGIARQAARREGLTVVGLTAPGNIDFTESIGVYDLVVAYGDEGHLPEGRAVYVDVSGSAAVRAGVHHRYGDDLTYDMMLGGTHWDDMGGASDLPGPKPAFFFAPGQISKRSEDWGQAKLDATIGAAWADYAPWAASWIEFQHDSGPDAVAATYLELLDNKATPSVGHILTLTAGTVTAR